MQFEGIKRIMDRSKIDLIIIYNIGSETFDKNLFYFTGYRGVGLLAIPRKKQPFMIVPLMEVERAKKTSGMADYEWQKKTRLFENLKKS
jgi:predicted glycosyltransferase